jgi:hypothetical protein
LGYFGALRNAVLEPKSGIPRGKFQRADILFAPSSEGCLKYINSSSRGRNKPGGVDRKPLR